MSFLIWSWIIEIAPAPIIESRGEKGRKKMFYKRLGGFQTRRTFSGLRLPAAGEMVLVPDYGPCKVERVIGIRSRSYYQSIIISPKSIGNDKWWEKNRNHPISIHSQNWKLNTNFIRDNYRDLDLPEDCYLEDDYFENI